VEPPFLSIVQAPSHHVMYTLNDAEWYRERYGLSRVSTHSVDPEMCDDVQREEEKLTGVGLTSVTPLFSIGRELASIRTTTVAEQLNLSSECLSV
jgi:hypothetical protein